MDLQASARSVGKPPAGNLPVVPDDQDASIHKSGSLIANQPTVQRMNQPGRDAKYHESPVTIRRHDPNQAGFGLSNIAESAWR
jgi:hypothetical protein